ncbi:chromate efflux transporter [Thalassotalea atypica]|uniref:chromate efflux transporter n=1 Tax=Thalassotalea atypica TaxID=2054316 RepID=UPI0025742EFA|nr:chromate efflux transporter [Thalassotalea atypica]
MNLNIKTIFIMNPYLEIFWRFFNLGLISFGGPAAHIGYFQQTFVQKYKWLDVQAYGRIVALSQFLPGPGSSQVGFAIGIERAGLLGGIMAFLGFTLPSFLLMLLLAMLGSQFSDTTTFSGMVYGLKLLAVVIVADAILTMAKSFCQQKLHLALALVSAIALILVSTSQVQIGIIIIAALVGALFAKQSLVTSEDTSCSENRNEIKKEINVTAALSFLLLFLLLPLASAEQGWLAMFNDFYQAGSLVFGGGHVVLPLLQHSVGTIVTNDQFLTGYAAAQAVPGPMFTFATFLGAQLMNEHMFIGAIIATLALFLPGFLLIVAFSKAWHKLSSEPLIASALSSVNAAVVGILIAAMYQPISQSAIHSIIDVLIVIAGFILLKFFRLPVLALVVSFATFGVILKL